MDGGTALPLLRLRRHEERRIRHGHTWIYSNEIDTEATPLKGFTPGDQALLCTHQGRALGVAMVNPHSLICARLLERGGSASVGAPLLQARLAGALRLRERLFAAPYYRLAYGDSDALPGLVVDRFGDQLVVQIGTAGMERLLPQILEVLQALLSPRGILLRNDGAVRELEQLEAYTAVAAGEVPELLELEEHGARFRVSARHGQKTGWFYDHRPGRARLAALAGGARVLDVFSYVGAWGVQAARAGAREVHCIDSSGPALALAAQNAALNGVAGCMHFHEEPALAGMQRLAAAGQRFDIVVLDPPAFIKRRRDQKSGEHAYQKLNREAMNLLADEAILVSASCSMHLAESQLLELVQHAALQAGRTLQVLEFTGQGPDHPVHPAIPETRYLKTLFLRVSQ
jgi:23S rRNA (cytosine1962-C5)-methyltransferase